MMATDDQQINFFVTRIFADVMTDVIAHIIQRLYDILVYYHDKGMFFFYLFDVYVQKFSALRGADYDVIFALRLLRPACHNL
jgi:hypothetical protein